MAMFVEKSARNVDEAISLALNELGLTRHEVDIEVIEEGSKAVLGLFGGKDAKVRVTVKKTAKNAASNFIKEMLRQMDIAATVSVEEDNEAIRINISGDNIGLLIGRRGDTLDSLQYLTSLVANKESEDFKKVIIDIENYREKREETLVKLANRMADKVIKTRKNITLEPMNPYERRIIHATLQDNKYIDTYSIGEDPERKIVIRLKK